MLSAILGILGSGGFGSMVGLAGGYFNRKLDLEAKKVDHNYELAVRDKDREYMVAEYGQRLLVADKENLGKQIVAEGEVEVAGYAAMAKSYDFAVPTSADGWVDKASKVVRPVLTLAFFLFTCLIFWKVSVAVQQLSQPLPPDKLLELWIMVIQWVLFQAGVCIGWWFAMRPGKPFKFN